VGWAISILLGAGSLIVGLLVRVLPPMPIPSFLYKDYQVDEKVEIVPTIVVVGGESTEETTRRRSVTLWNVALRKTKMQVKVIKAFQMPKSASKLDIAAETVARESVAANQQHIAPKARWSKLRDMLFPGGVTRRGDNSGLIVVDPRSVRAARQRLARNLNGNNTGPS
jgi:hypothetical protein